MGCIGNNKGRPMMWETRPGASSSESPPPPAEWTCHVRTQCAPRLPRMHANPHRQPMPTASWQDEHATLGSNAPRESNCHIYTTQIHIGSQCPPPADKRAANVSPRLPHTRQSTSTANANANDASHVSCVDGGTSPSSSSSYYSYNVLSW